MPEPITMAILAGILFVTVGVAIAFWPQILDWAEQSLFPWLKRNLPSMVETVRYAFYAFDKVAVAVRTVVKQAWKQLREYLLMQVIEFERISSKQWTKRVTSWVRKVIETGQAAAIKHEIEEVVEYDQLPADVREAYLRRGEMKIQVNITELRDKEVQEMTA